MVSFPEVAIYAEKIFNKKEAVSFKGETLRQLQELMTAMCKESEIERFSSLIKILAIIANPENTHAVGKPIVEDKRTKRIQKIQLYVMNNYQNLITLDEIAQLVSLDRSSFCIFFKKTIGKTFFTYLTECRIEASCQMITKTSMTIAEICYSSGFKDVPYYNRVFKKIKNLTPTEYRNQAQQKG